ncbi:unnamed protein product (macronuclear) [Paramecium tetraurelia]|uniref:Uncharacterized protein n=1 Tax=Paramecium tetraurelia TaxID=5888 RepID=A0CDZ1_PARTE|nr:uncharacterized protein GSPATT00007220001 [Paramecium tetraurelia]CAK69008.1 unnamed protein product [Paramecium tetraurelia]|eukprot:XP_001436405.1 hypothetical protein (macronuclear) [Paramecium tetraurelia strain d4-2]
MLILFFLVGSLSQSTYYITVDDALSDLLKTQPKGYKPWHPSLNVRLRVQEEERTQEFYSFVQQQIKIKQRGINTQHPMQFVQVQGPEFFENLVCKCSFSPAEAAQEEEEGGEGGGEEAEGGGACEAEGGGDHEGGEGEGEEVEFIVKKTKAHGKDFSFLQVGTQSNLNQYIPQPQQVDQLSQYDLRLQAQELLIKQFMEKQNQLTQQLSLLQQSQGVFVPSLFPQVVDPNYLTPQQQAQMLYMMQLQQQQQQIQQQLLQQQMLNPLSFQSSPTIVKNDNIQTQQQYQIPLQQPIAYTQTVTQPIMNQQQLLLQQQLLQQQQIPQQLTQQQLLQQQQQLLNQQQIPQAQPQQQVQSQIPQQIPSFQQQQIPQQQIQGFQQQIPQQQIQQQNIQQQPYQQIPQQQIQQQQSYQQIPQQQQQIQQQQQSGFLQQPQQQQNVPQLEQLLAQQMAQPLMQPQFLQKQPQIIGVG